MGSADYRIDILTDDEELFQSQVRAILEQGIKGFKNISEVETHHAYVESAYYALFLRLNDHYGDVPKHQRPDYSQLSLELDLWRKILHSQLISKDYENIKNLVDEARQIAQGKRC